VVTVIPRATFLSSTVLAALAIKMVAIDTAKYSPFLIASPVAASFSVSRFRA
jgi:hypothetical protein